MPVRLRRVYDPPSAEDGERFLVERLWPRGLTKERAHVSGWLKELAPTDELRRWFGHEPDRWPEFQQRYRAQLQAPEKRELLRQLAERARSGTITLVFAARDTEHNNALALKEVLEQQAQLANRQ